jgi:hypothetical protein
MAAHAAPAPRWANAIAISCLVVVTRWMAQVSGFSPGTSAAALRKAGGRGEGVICARASTTWGRPANRNHGATFSSIGAMMTRERLETKERASRGRG